MSEASPQHHQDHDHHDHHDHHGGAAASRSMAVSATLHCLTGCAIGEIVGLVAGTALGLGTGWTIVLAVGLAFLFGYLLSSLPLLRAGLAVGTALGVVLAADTVSIATMELVDNAVMAVVPGAMDAGLVDSTFWFSMMLALVAAFAAAYPVNRHLLARGKGHALTHRYHDGGGEVTGARRFIPDLPTPVLVGVVAAFLCGGLTVALADELGVGGGAPAHAGPTGPTGPAAAGAATGT